LKTLNITTILTVLVAFATVLIPGNSEAKVKRDLYECFFEHIIEKEDGTERSKYEYTINVVAPFLCPSAPPPVLRSVVGDAAFKAHLDGDGANVEEPDDIKCSHISHSAPTIPGI